MLRDQYDCIRGTGPDMFLPGREILPARLEVLSMGVHHTRYRMLAHLWGECIWLGNRRLRDYG